MQHLYIAKEKFGPFSGTAWTMYITGPASPN